MFVEDAARDRRARRIRNWAVTTFIACGWLVAAFVDFPKDPVRPYLVVVGFACVLKINMDFLLGLPMGLIIPVAMPPERRVRKRVLAASWGVFVSIVWTLVAR